MKELARGILSRELKKYQKKDFGYFKDWIGSKHIEAYDLTENGEYFQIEIQAAWVKKDQSIEIVGSIDYPQKRRFLRKEETESFLVTR